MAPVVVVIPSVIIMRKCWRNQNCSRNDCRADLGHVGRPLMSGPPHGNAETARWSQTVVDKFPSFVVDTTENSTLPERSGAQILRQTRREGDRQLNLAVLCHLED